MSERRVQTSRRTVAALLLVVALALSACGVPSHSEPIIDPNLATTSDQVGSGGPPPLPSRENFIGDAPAHFVEDGYLTALASQLGAAQQLKSVNQFMAPNRQWSPPAPLNGGGATASQPVAVVRVVDATQPVPSPGSYGGTRVTINVQVLGMFNPDTGILASQAPKALALTFDLSTDYQLTLAPAGYFMTESALSEPRNYRPQVIYFPTASGQLIPDLRYLESWLSPRQQATYVVNWLLEPPPAWMGNNKVVPFVQGVQRLDPTMTVENGAFVVNLQATTLTSEQEASFVAQVRWSLGTIHTSDSTVPQPVELQIVNRKVRAADAGGEFLGHNQSAVRDSDPIAYAIVDGKVQVIGYVPPALNPVVRLANISGPTKAALDSPDNKNVVFAAIHTTGPSAADVALIRSVNDRQQLWVSRPDGGPVKYTRVKPADLPKSVTFSRPVWLTQAPGWFAVVADGRLYVVSPKNQFIPVQTTSPAPEITSFSIGQDGYRIAYVSGHQVSIALLTVSAQSVPTMWAPSLPINLSGPTLDQADSVAWSSISTLVVAGTRSGAGLTIEVNCDGSDIATLTTYTRPQVPQIVSYPGPPQTTQAFSPVMVQQADGAFGGRAQLVKLSEGKNPTPINPFFGE